MDGLLLAPPGTQPGSENDTQGHKHLFITSDKEEIAVGVVRTILHTHHTIIPITTALLCMMQRVEDFNWLEFL